MENQKKKLVADARNALVPVVEVVDGLANRQAVDNEAVTDAFDGLGRVGDYLTQLWGILEKEEKLGVIQFWAVERGQSFYFEDEGLRNAYAGQVLTRTDTGYFDEDCLHYTPGEEKIANDTPVFLAVNYKEVARLSLRLSRLEEAAKRVVSTVTQVEPEEAEESVSRLAEILSEGIPQGRTPSRDELMALMREMEEQRNKKCHESSALRGLPWDAQREIYGVMVSKLGRLLGIDVKERLKS